jgi:hypothetical protein
VRGGCGAVTAHAAGARKPHKEALSTEDREIKMLESKLGLSSSNSGLKKLQKCVRLGSFTE